MFYFLTPPAKIDPCQEVFFKKVAGLCPPPPSPPYIWGGYFPIKGGIYIEGVVLSS